MARRNALAFATALALALPLLDARSVLRQPVRVSMCARDLSGASVGAALVDVEGAAAAGADIRPSPGKGMGAFAARARGAGELVGDYVGEIMSAREKDARYLGLGEVAEADRAWIESRRQRGVTVSGAYILGVGGDIFVDAEDPQHSNWCRYLNHDNAPNIALKTLPRGLGGKPRAWFVTLRAVQAGEELVFDYGDDYWHDSAPGSSPV
ncbi:hypothetical protein T492DRAFT_958411 [Pavlovales sp. CCMP2436]|nr:hypothetical protein T492DRAFT_958411 [Pavlovales sp. CCMP2436]